LYVFSRSLSFTTIPKACGFEAATLSPLILLGGSLIPIVVIGMGMVLTTTETNLKVPDFFLDFPARKEYDDF